MNYLDIFNYFYGSITFPKIEEITNDHIIYNGYYTFTRKSANLDYVITLAKDLYTCNIPFIIDSLVPENGISPMYYINEDGNSEYFEKADDFWRTAKLNITISDEKIKKLILLRNI